MIETKEVSSTLKRNISQEIGEDSDSDSDSDMFSSQSQQMFSSQNQSPFTPKSLIMSKAQTPMSEREKELDDQFEVCVNNFVSLYVPMFSKFKHLSTLRILIFNNVYLGSYKFS